jgi:hypothetical protein
LTLFTEPPDFGRSAIEIQQTRLRWTRKSLQLAYLLAALLPAIWVLSHPTPVAWLRPICKDTWPILAICGMAAILPFLCRRGGGNAWSLSVIALTQAAFQAWCYNTGSHPSRSALQLWGIFPVNDANFYYTEACELLNGQQITLMFGGRQPYPLLLAVLLKIFRHDFRLVTSAFTILMALSTWSAFEVIRLRFSGFMAATFLVCLTFFIRVHCAGLFMTEQLAVLYSLCAVAMLVESVATRGKAKPWLYCGGLFFLTQALNARPAAYMTLPFLLLASWQLFDGNPKVRGKTVFLSAIAVAMSFLLYGITYQRVVAVRAPSNAWYCIYGMLNGGTWGDGLKHSQQLSQHKSVLTPANWQATISDHVQGLRLLREECLSEIRHHPDKLGRGWSRAAQFLWSKNTPFRAVFPEMPSVWFTEPARWCTVLGLALSLFFLLRSGSLFPKFNLYQGLSWLNVAALLGMITSLPFAPPWDGETRIYAATLPLFFLLPAFGIGGLYLLILNRFRRITVESNADSQSKFAIGSAVIMGGTLSLLIVLASWCLVRPGSVAKSGWHPVRVMIGELVGKRSFVSSFDLRLLQAGYHLRLTDDTQPTWLPNISRKDFTHILPGGPYLPLSSTFSHLPPGTSLVVLPYYVWLVLDEEDTEAQRFTPRSEQTGHVLSPPVYFSKGLNIQNR